MKKINYINLAFLIALFTAGCDSVIDVEERPEIKERSAAVEISFIDSTGTSLEIAGSEKVPGVEVILRSSTLGLEYSAFSNEEGIVRFNDMVSDKYMISFRRQLTPEEKETMGLPRLKMYKLLGTSPGQIEARADQELAQTIVFDTLIIETPLVISEIYASGPSEAGLYYHDKYIEIYNQSGEVIYLDSLLLAYVYSSEYYGHNYVNDPYGIHTKNLWMFPGDGDDYPIEPGQFVVCAEDAIDHRINAPNSVDLSEVSFEFYKDDAPDIDNPAPNMIRIYQPAGNDWLIGGEEGALVIASYDPAKLTWFDDQMMFPYSAVLDGVEYLSDVTKQEEKILNYSIDAGATGGVEFYTGKTMERIPVISNGQKMLKDDNNSSLDFKIYEHPSPEYHNGF